MCPLALISIATRVDIESTKLEQRFCSCSSWYQIWIIPSINFDLFVQSCLCNLFLWLLTSFLSDGGLGDFQATVKHLPCSLKIFCIIFDVWHGTRSCCKMAPPSQKVNRTVGSRYLVKISLYLMEFTIPLTGISLPVPSKVKQPQNIFFGGCFGVCSVWSPWGVLPYFVHIETDILELQNDFRQRV